MLTNLTLVLQVLGTFQNAILRSHEETELDAVLVFQLVSFLVDHHMDIMEPPTDMKDAVENRLRSLEKPQVNNLACSRYNPVEVFFFFFSVRQLCLS